MSVSEFITGSRVRRTVAAQLTIDESTALAISQPDPADREGAFWAGGLSVFLFWNIGTLAGALGGNALGDPSDLGLDAAFPAAFVALIMPSLKHRPGLLAAVAGALIAAIAIPFTEPGLPILLASLGAGVALRIAGPPPELAAALEAT